MVLGYIGGPLSRARQAVDIYRAAGEKAGHPEKLRQPGQAIMIGSSEELVEKIVDAHRLLRIDRFYGQFDWGALPRPIVEDSMHRLAAEIAPAVRSGIEPLPQAA